MQLDPIPLERNPHAGRLKESSSEGGNHGWLFVPLLALVVLFAVFFGGDKNLAGLLLMLPAVFLVVALPSCLIRRALVFVRRRKSARSEWADWH